jgi:hypothetical protein
LELDTNNAAPIRPSRSASPSSSPRRLSRSRPSESKHRTCRPFAAPLYPSRVSERASCFHNHLAMRQVFANTALQQGARFQGRRQGHS